MSCKGWCCSGESGVIRSSYDIVEAAGLVAAAKKNGVTIKPTDEVFVINGHRAIGCVRRIRRKLVRLAGCWVHPDERGQGLGERLVRYRVDYAIHHTAAMAIDTFAFRPKLFLKFGFEERNSFKIGTTLLRKVIQR